MLTFWVSLWLRYRGKKMSDTTIKQIPKYESYKDSGVEWLGFIPTMWDVKKIYHMFRIGRGRVISQQELVEHGKYPVYSSQTKNNGVLGYIQTYDFDCEQITWTTDGANAGTVFLRQGKHNCTNVCGTLQPFRHAEIFTGFAAHALSDVTRFYKRPDTNGAKIMNNEMAHVKLMIPPLEEQKAIAKFLDIKIMKIDEAIAIKQKQIELLKERKQIIIQQAVTQGLNPDAPMKDSGVDWIGEIPEHWGVVRFKNLFTQSRLPVRKGDGVVTSYRDGQVTLRSNRRVGGYTEAILEGGYQGIRKGQLVLNSMDAFEGAIGVSDSDGKCTPEYVICDPINSVDVSQYYFAYLLREMALAKYIQVICNAVRQRAVRIRYSNLAPLFMVVPPIKEQEDIVSFIEKESAKLDAGIKHLNEQISKLKEYKTTLINSAVTGKIKVTELA
ncbi:TPA: restriction endonuclease subunit S [Vibrio diabolicus]